MSKVKRMGFWRKNLWKDIIEILKTFKYNGTKKDASEKKIKDVLIKKIESEGYLILREAGIKQFRADVLVEEQIPIEIKVITKTTLTKKVTEARGQMDGYLTESKCKFGIIFLWDKRDKRENLVNIEPYVVNKKKVEVIIS